MRQPIGILGGTFDPVHNAHIAIARLALEKIGATRISWIPTGAPRYRKPPQASSKDRVAMLRLALAGESRFVIDERELGAEASGYTVDTLAGLTKDFPSADLKLLMGADQFAKLQTWHRWEELHELCEIVVFARPGWKAAAKARTIPMAPLAISASDIRAGIGRGEDVSAMLPAAVLGYIREHGLYR